MLKTCERCGKQNNMRLTARRCNGIKEGYWSMAHKDELVQRLGQYEDILDTPEGLIETLKSYDDIFEILITAIRNAVNAPDDEENRAKMLQLVILYDLRFSCAKAQEPPSEPSSAI